MQVRALAADQPVAPRKVRAVLDLIKGRPVAEALTMLEFLPQPSAKLVYKVVRSAAANAENNFDLNPDGLVVKSAVAGDSRKLRRFRAAARGRVRPRIKRYSHIEIIVEGDETF
jgi:large subunit ribosomal protein L22